MGRFKQILCAGQAMGNTTRSRTMLTMVRSPHVRSLSLMPAGPPTLHSSACPRAATPVQRSSGVGAAVIGVSHADERSFLDLFGETAKRRDFSANSIQAVIERFEQLPEVITGKALSKGFLVLKNGPKYSNLVSRQLEALRKRCISIEDHTRDQKFGGVALNQVAVCIGSLRYLDADSADVRYLLRFLATRIKKAKSTDSFLNHQISNALFGLRKMSSDVGAVRELVSALVLKIPQCPDTFTSLVIGNSLYGLQNMSSNSSEVRSLLTVLAEKISESPDNLSAKDIGSALYGLQNLRSQSKEVKYLVSVLSERIAASTEHIDGLAVDNALYGLKNMRSEEAEVRRLLVVLANKIAESSCDMTPTHFSNALYGLQHMSGQVREVRELLAAILTKAPACREPFSAHNISVAMYGIQNMGSEFIASKQVIAFLTDKIEECSEPFNSIALSNSVLGLKQMSSTSAQVNRLLAALSVKLKETPTPLDGQAIGNIMHGIRQCRSDSPQCCEFVRVLVSKLASCSTRMSHVDIGRAMYALHNLDPNLDPSLYVLLRALLDQIENCDEAFSAATVSRMIYSLRNMDLQEPTVVELVRVIERKLELSTEKFRSVELGNAFLGLQNKSSDDPIVATLLQKLGRKLQHCPIVHPPDICNIFIDGKLSEDATRFTSAGYSGRGLCDVLFSLRAMSGKYNYVVNTLGSVQILLEIIDDAVLPSDLCRGISGLSGFTDDVPEIIKILDVLTKKIVASKLSFQSSDIASALSGIKFMNPQNGSVLALLSVLSCRLRELNMTCRKRGVCTPWTVANLLMAVSSIRTLDASHDAVIDLLKAVEEGLLPTSEQERVCILDNVPDESAVEAIRAELTSIGEKGKLLIRILRKNV